MRMNLQTQIQQLYENYGAMLAPYIWASESARWTELVFCLLYQCSDQDPENIRAAVKMLQKLDLLEVDKLNCLNDPNQDTTITFLYILKQHGFTEESVQLAVKVLVDAGNVVEAHYGKKIQRYLRQYGQVMQDELVSKFGNSILTKTQLQYAIGHWIQNTCSLPISLESKGTRKFLETNGANIEDLFEACDALGINIAIVDDLLELHENISPAIAENSSFIEG
jgi:hypothetical protein